MPLWEPERTKYGEVEIGDVGYLHNGGFYRLFNATFLASNPINHTLVHERPNAIPAIALHNKSLRVTEVNAQATSQVAGAGLSFQHTGSQGAILALEDAATRKELHSSRRMTNYMHQNYDDWHHFATEELGLELKPGDIIFVRGWVKTTGWAVASFMHSGRSCSLTFNTNPSLPGTASLNVSVSSDTSVSQQCRKGPTGSLSAGSTPIITNADSSSHPLYSQNRKADQCVFVHYYKLKRRLWWPLVVEDAADPRDLEEHEDYDFETCVVSESMSNDDDGFEVEGVSVQPEVREHFIAANDIMSLSFFSFNADVAIAHDGIVPELCRKFASPLDAGTSQSPKERPISDNPLPNSGTSSTSMALTHTGQVTVCDISHDGKYIATGCENTFVRLWDLATGVCHIMQTHKKAVWQVLFHPAFPQLLSVSSDGSVMLSPDGRLAAVALVNFSIGLWNTQTGKWVNTLSGHSAVVLYMTFSDSIELIGHEEAVMCAAFSCDASRVVTGSDDGTTRLWSTGGGGRTHHISVALTPDEQRVISVGDDARISITGVWGEEDLRLVDEDVLTAVAVSPDGSLICSGCRSHVIKIWSMETGEMLHQLQGHRETINKIQFFPTGDRLRSISDDRTARVWSFNAEEWANPNVL
ncbi:hypothetical protein CERSUDRAFT_107747 [Gelatoporia subvermispora B]|uniref:Anaphase-promoting complex subunit 4-like WD40 domain-containing protein n=1 Tax=Ceriporiopsis subvermispora (strain B) TaxID=914234 RepID=M2R6R5_CERS8|nr:hypothetical protein CERSUDRAFT_107747 [Gelatoporia subvermispora B]